MIPVKVHLIGEQGAVQGTESAEGVGGEEDLRRFIISDHDLRPVDHGGHNESEAVSAGREAGLFIHHLHRVKILSREEVLQHGDHLAVGDDGGLRVAQQQLADRGGVVRLHVLDHEIIQAPAGQHMVDVFKKDPADRVVHRVEQNGFLVQQQIGIVGHAVGDGIDALEQGQPPVIAAHPYQIVGHISCAVHKHFLHLFIQIFKPVTILCKKSVYHTGGVL